MTLLFPISMAMTAYFCLSLGFILMKAGIGWLRRGKTKDLAYYRLLALWVVGLIITNIYGVPSALALRHLPAHLVSVFAGWGIVVLLILSRLILREKIYRSDFIYSLLIMVGIFFLHLHRTDLPDRGFSLSGLIVFGLIPVGLFVIGFLKIFPPPLKTAVMGSVSGLSAGVMIVALRILVQIYHYQVGRYFSSPFAYLYIGAALLSFTALQLAFKSGPMMITGPAQYSTTIVYPLIAAWLVFHQDLHLLPVSAVLLIMICVILILKKR